MSIINQYLDILNTLDDLGVDYMVIGGHAVNHYGYSRTTLDMDIWVCTKPKNLEKLYKSFIKLGYPETNSQQAIDYLERNHMIKIPLGIGHIDLMDSFMAQSDFDRAYINHETKMVNGIEVKFIGLDELIECKLRAKRNKDLLDAKELKTLQELRNRNNS